jgi:transposase
MNVPASVAICSIGVGDEAAGGGDAGIVEQDDFAVCGEPVTDGRVVVVEVADEVLEEHARAGVFNRIRDQLRRAVRLRAGRCPNPVTGIIDSQSVRAAATVTGRSRSYDAGKKVGGRKRHLVVDTRGMLMMVMVTPAGQPDRDAARDLLARLRLLHPQLTLVWGDSAYAGTLVQWARRFLRLTVKIVTKRPGQTGFKVLARRWIVERSIGWLMNARRNVIDFERKPAHSEAHLTVAAITLMTRRLTRKRLPAWTRKPTSAPQAA